MNWKLRCVYLIGISARVDELTVDSSDRYHSFNKFENTSLTESHMPDIEVILLLFFEF